MRLRFAAASASAWCPALNMPRSWSTSNCIRASLYRCSAASSSDVSPLDQHSAVASEASQSREMLVSDRPPRRASSNFFSFSLVLAGLPLHNNAYSSPVGQLIGRQISESCIRYSMTPPVRLAAISTPLPLPSWSRRCACAASVAASSVLFVSLDNAVTRATVNAALDPSPSFTLPPGSINSAVSIRISKFPSILMVAQTSRNKSRLPPGGSSPIHSKSPSSLARNVHSPLMYPQVRTV